MRLQKSLTLLGLTPGFLSLTLWASPIKLKKENLKVGRQVVETYANLAHRLYLNAIASAEQLQAATLAFTKEPSAASQNKAQEAWKSARRDYSHTEALRFYGGPIDDAEKGPEGFLNAWPLDEAYIDYVKGNPKAGIIQNPEKFPTITKDLLMSLNEKDGEKNIATGFHAVEFLLWGQDFSVKGPGQRSFKEYDAKSNAHATRRATYLNLLSELIVEHLKVVELQWNPKTKNSYRQAFLKEPLDEALRRIFTGVTTLSVDEMAGERLTVALEIHDQENEQDCFSDFSLVDSTYNQEGIWAVMNGRAPGESSAPQGAVSVLDLVQKENPAFVTEILAAEKQVQSAQKSAIAAGTFDQIIANKNEKSAGRSAVRQLIEAYDQQGAAIARAGKAMGLILNVDTEVEIAK